MNIEEEFRFDVRIQQRLLKKGLVQESELSARLAGLKDLENEYELMEVEQPGITPVAPEAPEAETP